MLLSEAIHQYALELKVNNVSRSTQYYYANTLKYLIELIGDMPVQEFNANHVRNFIANEMGRTVAHTQTPLSSRTLHKEYGIIRSFSNWMERQGFVDKAPTRLTKPPKYDLDLPEALTNDEIKAIFEYIDTNCTFRDRVIFEFFLDTGCRVAEVADLTLDNVFIDEGWAKVKGKGRKEGIVPLGRKLCRDLNLYISRYRKAEEGENGVFTTVRRPYTSMTRNGMLTLIKKIHKAAGVNGKYGSHKLRHTMATQFIANGGDVAILKRILRHTDIKTTQVYINLAQGDIQDDHRKHSPLDNFDFK
jgi:site-specific recombinase XerD